MRRPAWILAPVVILGLLAACNLPYTAQPTTSGPAPEASATSFSVATQEAATTTQPSINILTTTPGGRPSTPPEVTLSPAATMPSFVTFTPPATTTAPSAATDTPPATTTAPSAATGAPTLVYPDTPDGVIQAFVEAYPDDTAGMLEYLGASLRASLPAGGPGELLNVQGDINGMLILSGAAVPNPPQAEFQVALEVGAVQVLRTFTLAQENGRWVITGIQ